MKDVILEELLQFHETVNKMSEVTPEMIETEASILTYKIKNYLHQVL